MDTADHLADLLMASARGDREAFRRFYDITCGRAFHLELVRARAGGALHPRTAAERATADRFLRAWRAAPAYAGSGLSPVAWLLTLPTPPASPTRQPVGACVVDAIA